VDKSGTQKALLLFNLLLIQRTASAIPEAVMSTEVFPRLFPYLHFFEGDQKRPVAPTADEKDLFELAHELIVIVFQNVHRFKRLVEDFAPWYTDLLLTVSY
jgi:hypothetical protein